MAVYDAVQSGHGRYRMLRRAPRLGIRLLARNPNMSIGLLILGVMGVVAIFAPFIDRYDPLRLAVEDRLMSPNSEHWFGTDSFGRDLYSRTVHGAKLSLLVGASVVVIAAIAGEILGLIAGYDRRMDAVLMRIVDGIMAFPGLLLALALIAMLGSSIQNVIIAISVNAIPSIARVVRSSVLSLRERPFVEAARATGVPTWRILLVHIAPNTLGPVTIQATFLFAVAMLTEAGLSFIGAGVPDYVPSWGNIVSMGRNQLYNAPWIVVIPGIFLTMTVLAANLVGDGLRDMIDPRLRGTRT